VNFDGEPEVPLLVFPQYAEHIQDEPIYADLPEAQAGISDTKESNPKDAIGSTKLPLDLVPDTLTVMAALAFTEGATKYGAYNWRVAGVRASIYRAALDRHLKKWWNGENVDPVTGVPHLASVIACAGIILDANLAGKLTDDRPPAVPLGELIDSLEVKVKHLKALHADKKPHHHTELDKRTIGPETSKSIQSISQDGPRIK